MDESNGQHNGQHQHGSKGWQFTFVGGTNLEAETVASGGQTEAEPSQFSLARTKAGDRVWITDFKDKSISHWLELGLAPGAELEVINGNTRGSVVVAVQGRCLGFGASIAAQILVTDNPVLGKKYKQEAIANANTHLRDLPVGARGCVVGYDRAFLGYMGKLLAMGLQPGTAFTVIRHALFGHLVEIEVQGVTLSLRKPEADALCVEEVEE